MAIAAESVGLDAVFAYDHLFRYDSDGGVRPALEFASALGALCAETDSIAIASLVARATLRPPSVLTGIFVTAQRIAGERIIAGIGAGDEQSRDEMEQFGYDFGDVSSRVEALEASTASLMHADIPVWVGGDPKYVGTAAMMADGWNRWGVSQDRFAREATQLNALRENHGGDPLVISWGGLCVLGATDDEAEKKAERLGASKVALVGGPERIAEMLVGYVNAGASWIALGPIDSSDPSNAIHAKAIRDLLNER
ncbi:MAG: LLM class flavin-dependent oxidoreductase [Actinobacteria bacterium]|nr:LLM class flavin-dependent oxidoreductase [Actinomycetota bacterium]